jgi:hypothetical protein
MDQTRVRGMAAVLAVGVALFAASPGRVEGDQSSSRAPATELLDRYERGDWLQAGLEPLPLDRLGPALDELKQVAPSWISARGTDQVARRRLAVAAYLIELLQVQAALAGGRDDLPPLHELVEWACALVRSGPPLPAERHWHLASLALLEPYIAAGGDPIELPEVPAMFLVGAIEKAENEPNSLTRHAEHGRARFPEDASFELIAAMGIESNAWPARRTRLPYAPSEELTKTIVSRYREVAGTPATRSRALTRLAYFELRRGRTRDALRALQDAGKPDDPVERYWVSLFSGLARSESGNVPEAIAAYRAALDAVPGAQSATVALAALLTRSGAIAEATSRVQALLNAPKPPTDPWSVFYSPELRLWAGSVAELRRSIAA